MDARILINVETLAPRVANSMVSFFQPIQGHKSSAFISNLGGRLKRFFLLLAAPLTPSEPLGLISTFAPIGMLDLS
jgi:hypothetical protein